MDYANEFTVGQSYPRWAQVHHDDTLWKYRKHQKAYGVLLMDAAHLSQTFYLVCTELGLGALVTAAINSIDIERRLGFDGFTEGAIMICGWGKPGKENFIDPPFRSLD